VILQKHQIGTSMPQGGHPHMKRRELITLIGGAALVESRRRPGKIRLMPQT
jgi:hypothetical protein